MPVEIRYRGNNCAVAKGLQNSRRLRLIASFERRWPMIFSAGYCATLWEGQDERTDLSFLFVLEGEANRTSEIKAVLDQDQGSRGSSGQ